MKEKCKENMKSILKWVATTTKLNMGTWSFLEAMIRNWFPYVILTPTIQMVIIST